MIFDHLRYRSFVPFGIGGLIHPRRYRDSAPNYAVLLRINLSKNEPDALKLLAMFWLWNEGSAKTTLKDFIKKREIKVSQGVVKDAVQYLRYWPAGETANGWTLALFMWGDPEVVWKYLLSAVAVAKTDMHLRKIVTSLAAPLQRRHPSLVPRFEEQARLDPGFRRMLAQSG